MRQLETSTQQLDLSALLQQLPPRAKDANKGNFGHVLVIGGHQGMGGAARLAGEAAARVGAGLVSLALHPDYVAVIAGARPELMCHGIVIPDEILPLLKKATVLVVGAGLGSDAWSTALFNYALASDLPKVIDADAINLLAKNPHYRENWVLTPHPGEASRLLDCTIDEVQTNREAAAAKIQKRYGGIAVLKGAGTLVQSASSLSLCTAGNPGMATGGMGDVLGGVIGGLIAQHLELNSAAQLGVMLHAVAADQVAAMDGERGMLASDLFPVLRKLVST